MKPRDQFGLDALLGRWPAQDPQENGGRSWEERATAITDAAVALEDRGSPEVLDALMAAPSLEPEPGEEKAADYQFDDAAQTREEPVKATPSGGPRTMSSDQSSQPKRPSLKELAARASQAGAGRASVTPLPPSVARSSAPPPVVPATVTPIAKARAARASDPGREDSGILRLADMQADEAAKAEAAAVAAESALAAQRAGSKSQQPAAAASVAKPAAPPPSSNKTGMWAGVAIAVIGVAAAFAVYRTRQPDVAPARTDAQAAAQPQSAPAATENPNAQGKAAAPAAVASSEPAPASSDAPKAEDPDSKGAAGTVAPTATAVASGDVKPSPTPDKPLVGSKVGTLDEEMKKAVGANDLPAAPQDDGSKPASGGGGNVPEQPSQGNAQAAIRAVMPAAKACVAGAPEPTSASITFASSGTATGVTVGGWAAANGKAACVKSALMGARVAPFAKPSFTVPVNVRP